MSQLEQQNCTKKFAHALLQLSDAGEGECRY